MKEFKYDVILLIQGVRDRPCLWNKSLEVYKDRVERRNAWEEIFTILDENYELMPAEERRLTGEHILNKWTNIRDTFIKSLKTKMGKPKRKYMLYDHMKFLINDINGEDPDYAEESVPYLKEENESEADVIDVPIAISRRRSKRNERSDDSYAPKEESSSSSSKKRKKKSIPEENPKPKDFDSSNDIDFVEVDDSGDGRLMNEDEAFFASLLPTIVKYNEDERLEFRIEVLSIMKKIKDNRRWNSEDP